LPAPFLLITIKLNIMYIPPSARLSIFLLMVVLAAACAPRTAGDGESELDQAILLYVAGDYETARDRFNSLTGRLQSDDDLETTYLYLARCHEAMGDYRAAVDALSAGLVIRGNELFQQHFSVLKNKIEGDPVYLRKQQELTRAHLACLFDELFLSVPGDRDLQPDPPQLAGTFFFPADVREHWAGERIRRVLMTGIMPVPPDSLFHPDDKVTRSAFYMDARRMERQLLGPARPGTILLPNGFEALLKEQLAVRDDPGRPPFISGSEAVGALERLRQEASRQHD
jgi:tetratricopeptide (TPR) repeat protein